MSARSPEPFVRCTRCGHLPCPCCGGLSCDEIVHPEPLTDAAIAARRAELRPGNAITAVTLPIAADADVWCEQCNERLPRRDVPTHADDGRRTLWFCSFTCANDWTTDPGESDICECGFGNRCDYGAEGRAQNERVEAWFRTQMGAGGGSCSVDARGWLTVHPQKES